MINMIHGDCMEYMATLPDKAFDLALTDPPYNVGLEYNEYKDNKTAGDYEKWCDEWFLELTRVCETVVITTGYKNIKYWVNKNPRHMIIWHKPNQSSPSPIGGFNAYEIIFYFGKLQKRIGHDIFVQNIALQPDAAFHSCPKYLPAWRKILNMCIDAPAKIFDPFSGSGTTAIACHDLGFDFIGTEIDADYYKAAVERYQTHAAQATLFEPAELTKETQGGLF